MEIENSKREIVILAKSRKHSAYCIAGSDKKDNQLVRVITDDEDIHYAVTDSQIQDSRGKVATLYDDIVIVTSENKIEIPHQPENIMIDSRQNIVNKGSYNSDDLKKIVGFLFNKYENIFYNSEACLSQNDIDKIEEKDRHSLEMINPQHLIIRVKDNEKKTLIGNVKYNVVWNNNLSITDTEFESEYYSKVINSENGRIRIDKPYILVSLGEEFNGKYYKLIACVLNL